MIAVSVFKPGSIEFRIFPQPHCVHYYLLICNNNIQCHYPSKRLMLFYNKYKTDYMRATWKCWFVSLKQSARTRSDFTSKKLIPHSALPDRKIQNSSNSGSMNNLLTSEERKARWYSKQQPRFVKVAAASSWDELIRWGHKDQTYEVVRSLPFEWLYQQQRQQHKQQKLNYNKIKEKLETILKAHGFLVVSGVLSENECQNAVKLSWDYIEAASVAEYELQQQCRYHQEKEKLQAKEKLKTQEKIDISVRVSSSDSSSNKNTNIKTPYTTNNRTSSKTSSHATENNTNSKSKNIVRDGTASKSELLSSTSFTSQFFPRSVEGGIMPFYGSGHSTFAWSIRSHPNIKKIFETLYSTSDLISSLDGIILWRSSYKRSEPSTDAGWFHVDQNPRHKPNFEAYQGLVNLLPVTPSTGGNVLIAKSHTVFPQHYSKHHRDDESKYCNNQSGCCADFYAARLDELGDEDWMEIDSNDNTLIVPEKLIMCLLNPGDVLLWDSRVVHCSYPGIVDDEDKDRVKSEEKNADKDKNREKEKDKDKDKDNDIDNDSDTDKFCGEEHNRNNYQFRYGEQLSRAATLVSMMPTESAPHSVLEARKEAVRRSRTLTHWANKVAPLGEERPLQVALELARVEKIKVWEAQRNEQKNNKKKGFNENQTKQETKVILDYEDLDTAQRRLVVGLKLAVA